MRANIKIIMENLWGHSELILTAILFVFTLIASVIYIYLSALLFIEKNLIGVSPIRLLTPT